ncbi:hypothetical protein IMPERIA89_450017 [Imperialibacter sp. 89]|nr:hypothetical protein IMPERIA89_450017 [Imperialibacter sp. 89]
MMLWKKKLSLPKQKLELKNLKVLTSEPNTKITYWKMAQHHLPFFCLQSRSS